MTPDRKTLERIAARPIDPLFYASLRKLEGAEFDAPFNFAWRLDFADIFQRDSDGKGSTGQGGFDLILGNPPFVTARDQERRELYRERWPLVCHREYELVSPFFQLGFGILRKNGQLGFIVSNGFTMRDFGKPLVERFFPSVHLQKVVDCDGLSFPGHGTPTCIVFGRCPSEHETATTLASHPVIVAGRLPGGGDLRTIPEESPLWSDLSQHHDEPGYRDERIVVAEQTMTDVTKWPMKFDTTGQSTRTLLEQRALPLTDFIMSCGSMFDTHKDDAFVLPSHVARRSKIEFPYLVPFVGGDQLRNWFVFTGNLVLKPYTEDWALFAEDKHRSIFRWLRMLKRELSGRATFDGRTYEEAGEPWFRYHQMSVSKITADLTIAYPEIATHAHFIPMKGGRLLSQTAPVLQLLSSDVAEACLLSGLLNSSPVLFWLKQVSFNKGAGKDEELDRFEYQGKRIKQIPVPVPVANALRGAVSAVVPRLAILAQSSWEKGTELPTLAFSRAFEDKDEAYYQWNVLVSGYVAPAPECSPPFTSDPEFRSRVSAIVARRESLRADTIALQEEMDWLAYAAYSLISSDNPAVPVVESAERVVPISREQRPFVLWQQAEGDFGRACSLIPDDWAQDRKALWQARLECIRGNEHIRRIEQPVYKRRWDEQWKVGNRWQSGPVAYDAELVDAFDWWLSEKAEWWLEHEAKGGPVSLDGWAAALRKDSRIQAAWPVVREALDRLGRSATFERYFGKLVKSQSVPDNIPWAVSWEKLEKKMRIPASVKRIRGKLNVPRERFRITSEKTYIWAGLRLFDE